MKLSSVTKASGGAIVLFVLSFHHSLINVRAQQEGFNFEVEKRVHERVTELMSLPVRQLNLTKTYISTTDTFPKFLNPKDRDAYFKLMFSISRTYKQDVFYGQEDGLFMGYVKGSGTYLEPAASGYDVENIPEESKKYYGACIDRTTGKRENCNMEEGDEYIECIDGCGLEPCPGENSDLQKECTLLTGDEKEKCEEKVVWCSKYTRKTVPVDKNLGYIPRYWYCVDENGSFTETDGKVFSPSKFEGSCKYGDGVTPVNGTIVGDYSYCGGNGQTCPNMFTGGYQSRRYDHRMRAWYEEMKVVQKRGWSEPYPFATKLDIGITYMQPIFFKEDGKNVFRGAFTVNYELEDITQFLKDSFFGTETSVLILEEKEPNYLVGLSTGSGVALKVLASDETVPCTDILEFECKVIRSRPSDLYNSDIPMDTVLSRAFAEQKKQGYPQKLISSKASEDIQSDSYVSQSLTYEQPNIKWRIIVAMPTGKSTSDSIARENSMFGVLCVIASVGFLGCCGQLLVYFKNRTNSEVMISDWRFTSAFILGCSFLNLSTFSLLGSNTNSTCMTRMWTFHFFFVLTLSPLLVKVWRMLIVVGGAMKMKRTKISHAQAVAYTMPFILVQIIILTVFSIVDPPQQDEYIEIVGGSTSQHVVCTQKSNAFMIVQLVFEGGLVVAGCVLAYKTRNHGSRLGEAKSLILAMYNILLVGVIVILIAETMNISQVTNYMVRAIGIFWATIFSSCVFVLPRLLRVKKSMGRSSMQGGASSRMSGGKSSAFRLNQNTSNNFRSSVQENVKEEEDSENKDPEDEECI
eukprot:CAMPEP_0194279574 /NCGR_PEP_ID=MMETSP0169-20130528/14007_1 /TAXON_ID=218684 /ORGANISM="Corethron pennatum, Strain L29A3" /LENGTH=803 /DNA_ID=CAMNT_0039024019 /DNA_START=67 /DNA_END=2478 /DNA_ORIENTATION=-